jgi:trimethylamine--corrinoid protein Co-methyltransferase
VDSCGHLILPRDVPKGLEDIYQYYGTALVSQKPFAPYILNPSSVRPLLDMAIVVEGSEDAVRQRKRFSYWAYGSSPLQYPADALAKALMVHDLGFPVGFGAPMTVAGATGPVTLAGTATLSNAEALAGITIAHALGHPGVYASAPVVLDMRTGLSCYADPRKVAACLASRDMTRYYGFPQPTFHVGLDAHVPGIQASAERMFVSMLCLFLWDTTPTVRLGVLGPSGMVCSLPHIFVDVEFVDMLNAFMDGIEVTDETLALDLIKQVGVGGNFLDTDHTARHFRKELWIPKLFERKLPANASEPPQDKVMERAIERTRETLSKPQPPPLPQDKVAELTRILKSAGGEPMTERPIHVQPSIV